MALCPMSLVKHVGIHADVVTTYKHMRSWVVRYVDARTSLEHWSAPADVEGLDAMKR